MAEINDLSITDASNTARFPENQAASTVNDGARGLEGIVARWHKDTNGSIVAGGSSSAYTVAANQTLSAYYDGLTLAFEANHTNTGATTLNVDAVGVQSVVWPDGTALGAGAITSGGKYVVCYDADNTQWFLMTGSNTFITTRGDVIRGSSTGSAERLAVGAANTFLGSDGTDTAFVAAATQAEQETGTALNKPVTPGTQHFHLAHPKAILILTTLTTTPTVTALYSSLGTITPSRTSAGDHSLSWVNTLTNPVVQLTTDSNTTTNPRYSGIRQGGLTGTAMRIISRDPAGGAADPDGIYVTLYGNLA